MPVPARGSCRTAQLSPPRSHSGDLEDELADRRRLAVDLLHVVRSSGSRAGSAPLRRFGVNGRRCGSTFQHPLPRGRHDRLELLVARPPAEVAVNGVRAGDEHGGIARTTTCHLRGDGAAGDTGGGVDDLADGVSSSAAAEVYTRHVPVRPATSRARTCARARSSTWM